MRIRAAISAVAIAALLVPTAAVAQNGNKPTYQVSGGGQFDVPLSGPGSTIAFVAQGHGEDGDDDVRGRLTLIDRENGTGQDQARFHGIVDCMIPDFVFDPGGADVEGVRFGGYERGGDPEDDRFLVDVVDNGQPSEGTDLIAFHDDGDDECNNGDDVPDGELGRGNVKIHDRRPENS